MGGDTLGSRKVASPVFHSHVEERLASWSGVTQIHLSQPCYSGQLQWISNVTSDKREKSDAGIPARELSWAWGFTGEK
jgi:hypothetical protein